MDFDFSEVLRRMVEARASDVHLTAGFPPAIRDSLDYFRKQKYCYCRRFTKLSAS